MHSIPTDAASLLSEQLGVATLDQLEAVGVSHSRVGADVAARRWQRYGDQCVVTHNFEPTRQQWMWIALLDNRCPTALAGVTSLEIAGFTYFGDPMQLIHIAVPRGATYHQFPAVKIHESRRFRERDMAALPALRLWAACRGGSAEDLHIRGAVRRVEVCRQDPSQTAHATRNPRHRGRC